MTHNSDVINVWGAPEDVQKIVTDHVADDRPHVRATARLYDAGLVEKALAVVNDCGCEVPEGLTGLTAFCAGLLSSYIAQHAKPGKLNEALEMAAPQLGESLSMLIADAQRHA
jgi:hypothetical protein